MLKEEICILVIDDVNTMRIQIRDLLKSFGFHTIMLSPNAEEAKMALNDGAVHLVLCDWHMEPTDGLELLRYLRSNSKFSHIPFVMVTAEATKEKVLEAIKAGVDDYLVKPLTIQQIQNKVYGVLMRKQVL